MVTNSTQAPSGPPDIPSSSSLALAVSLPLVFVLLASAIAAVVYTLRCKSRHIPQFEEDKKAHDSAQYTASPRYETNVATQPVRQPQQQQQQPIYENVHRGSTEGARDTADHETQRCQQQENLYLQCEPLDEAIYSNDPSYPGNSVHFDPSVEDEYVVPDVL